MSCICIQCRPFIAKLANCSRIEWTPDDEPTNVHDKKIDASKLEFNVLKQKSHTSGWPFDYQLKTFVGEDKVLGEYEVPKELEVPRRRKSTGRYWRSLKYTSEAYVLEIH